MATKLLSHKVRVSDDEVQECVALRHAWSRFWPTDMRPPLFGARESVRCDRCGTERHVLIDRTTGENRSAYDYRYSVQYAQASKAPDDRRRVRKKLVKEYEKEHRPDKRPVNRRKLRAVS